jgi:hypothetical protein
MNTYSYPALEDKSNMNTRPSEVSMPHLYYMPYLGGLSQIANTGEKQLKC